MTFLKNCWYVGARLDELAAGLVSRRICNELILLYRKEADGGIAALEDRCPHRFVPLSMGQREADTFRCGYHGLRFDATGACVERPGGKGENSAPICVKAYPVEERHGYAWLWMGDAALADPALIPDFAFLTDSRFATVHGYLNVKGHHELITDNLLDLSHVQWLHPSAASDSDTSGWENTVAQKGDTVWSMLSRPSFKPPAFQRHLWGSASELADGRANVRWDAPSVLYADTAIAEVGADIESTGLHLPSAHLLTPETEHSTHYFWATSRNAALDDKQLDEQLLKMVAHIFMTQDAPMIEAEQAAMGDSTDFLAHKPLILKADAAGIRARRVLRKRMRAETGAAPLIEAAE